MALRQHLTCIPKTVVKPLPAKRQWRPTTLPCGGISGHQVWGHTRRLVCHRNQSDGSRSQRSSSSQARLVLQFPTAVRVYIGLINHVPLCGRTGLDWPGHTCSSPMAAGASGHSREEWWGWVDVGLREVTLERVYRAVVRSVEVLQGGHLLKKSGHGQEWCPTAPLRLASNRRCTEGSQ
ncbi:hypothetical protein FA95DRAFT_1557115 [Auriscalpium vulgare]|uniref:Uncharacterized protein n=1 Tax=Auriscalpium vulgare TaxID=40419 RepID=A0ACB8RZ96_9AGAM|nr:hypothetical protein FA95DRAFT_1557115 [Auriscalpium vulgare]